MSGTIIGIVILVVALIVGPFATLRAISYYKGRKTPIASKPADDDENDPDKKTGFW